MREHEIIDLTEEDWESANVMSTVDYNLIMQTAQQLEQERAAKVSDWSWMAMGYED